MSMTTDCPSPNPAASLPLSDPLCVAAADCCDAFKAAGEASQATVSYTRQFQYGHWVSWYAAIWILIFTLSNAGTILRNRTRRGLRTSTKNTSAKELRPSPLQKLRTLLRGLGYRRPTGSFAGLPSLAVTTFLLLAVLFVTVLTFAARPYYRQHRGYGSPPLAIRTGLMAAACTPLLIALSGKANLISFLTGLGHERLNVVHRWVGWICFALSVAHTIPFLVAPLRDGGHTALRKQFYGQGAFEYTGVPPLAMLFGIVIFSVPYVRARAHSFFYSSHWLLAITYVGLCFWHFGDEGDSWAYLWATLALWACTVLARLFIKNQAWTDALVHGDGLGLPTRLQALSGGMTSVDVEVSRGVRWTPGQHVFVKVPGLSLLGNHPFTVASLPADDGNGLVYPRGSNTMKFLVRSRAGFTRQLWERVEKETGGSLRSCIDGPYGGVGVDLARMYDAFVMVAGGGGITAVLPWLQHIVGGIANGMNQVTKIKFIWIARKQEHFSWVVEDLKELASRAPPGTLEISFHVTRQRQIDSHARVVSEEGEKAGFGEVVNIEVGQPWRTLCERPQLQKLTPDLIDQPGRWLVFGCGPQSLRADLSNGVARAQKKVLGGKVLDIALHTEQFGY